MLGLGWLYRWGCIRLLAMQGLLLVLAITTLRFTGYGIDLIRWLARESNQGLAAFTLASLGLDVEPRLPEAPWGLAAPAAWPPLGQVALIAGLVLVCELFRAALNYLYALSAG